MLGIITTRQVSENGVALEHGQVVVVMVHNGGDTAVGVDGREPWFLLDVLRDVDALEGVLEPVCLLELLQQDVSLVAVGGACCFPWSVTNDPRRRGVVDFAREQGGPGDLLFPRDY